MATTAKEIEEQMNAWVVGNAREIQSTLFTRIYDETPVDTGYTQSQWETVSEIQKVGDTGSFENDAPAIVPLEYGHSDQAPTGMVRLNIQKIIAEGSQ